MCFHVTQCYVLACLTSSGECGADSADITLKPPVRREVDMKCCVSGIVDYIDILKIAACQYVRLEVVVENVLKSIGLPGAVEVGVPNLVSAGDPS